jgi:PAS domain S-box-containing protein
MNLFSKGLIYLSAVLLLQLFFYALLAKSLIDAEHLAEHGRFCRSMTVDIGRIGEDINAIALIGTIFVTMNSSELETRGNASFERMRTRIAHLKELPGATAADRKQLDALDEEILVLRRQLQKVVEVCSRNSLSQLSNDLKQQLTAGLIPQIDKIREQLTCLGREQNRTLLSNPELTTKAELQLAISAGIVGTVAINALLFAVFIRAIIARLNRVKANIDRRSRNETLAPPMEAGDEIGSLDRSLFSLSQLLDDSLRKDKAILANIPVGLVACSGDGRIEAENDLARKMLKFAPGELLGANIQAILSESIETLLDDNLNAVRRSAVRTKNGETTSVELSISSYEHDAQPKLLICFIDATEREELERLKQEFVSMVSHDVRIPICALKSCLTLVREQAYGMVNEDGKGAISNALQSADSLLNLTSNLLDVAKLESGNLALNMQPCSLLDLVEESLDAIQEKAASKDVELRASISAEITELILDKHRLQQVLSNLLSNAVKFSSPGQGILLAAQYSSGLLQISVSDSGCGMSADRIATLFDWTNNTPGGSRAGRVALGLPLCKMLIDAHGGEILVESAPGGGSTFTVCLPVDCADTYVTEASR